MLREGRWHPWMLLALREHRPEAEIICCPEKTLGGNPCSREKPSHGYLGGNILDLLRARNYKGLGHCSLALIPTDIPVPGMLFQLRVWSGWSFPKPSCLEGSKRSTDCLQSPDCSQQHVQHLLCCCAFAHIPSKTLAPGS